MSNYSRLLILFGFLLSSKVFAFDVFLDPIYWRATETLDWVLINSLSVPNQNVGFRTISFDHSLGIRAGINFDDDWGSKATYTWYSTKAIDSATGNLVSDFLGAKIIQGNNFFYQAGQIKFSIHLNQFDYDIGKGISLQDSFIIRPLIGVRGSRINQHITTSFQGPVSVTEDINNNFTGIGPKTGVETNWIFYRNYDVQYSLFSDFTTSYLWGRWVIRDFAQGVQVKVGNRNMGAFTVQGHIGMGIDSEYFSIKLGYEIGDWFNQFQIFDNGTGGHNNDLILQGLTLRLSFCF